jgi:hypothetical protein
MTGPFKLKTGKELEGFFKTPNPTTKAVKSKAAEKEDQANKASNKKRSDAEKALEAKEDAMGL